MNKRVQSLIKKELGAVKDMAFDFLPRLASILNPSVWQSSENFTTALGDIATSFIGGRLKKWFEEMIKNKDIDENVANSEKSKQVFLDLIKFVAKENPDIETWEAAKKIFVLTLEKNVEEQKRASLYELLNICRELSGSEIRILTGAYQIYKIYTEAKNPGYDAGNRSVHHWALQVSKEIGFETTEEVLRYEDNLVKQKLISPRESLRGDILDTWQPFDTSSGHRLTPLGHKFTESFTKNI